ncbi:DUF2188 domain-containing protein [Candidatus Gottesmanbacteria bacterium]|nr:DUF2188 domain-containing protein [Candidatus Gottesmanbacteria bacterium]
MKKIPLKTDQNNPAILAYKNAVEKGKKDQHILPRKNGWIVKNLLSDRTSQIFDTQQEAAKYAKSLASQGTAVFIHDFVGRIQERIDY